MARRKKRRFGAVTGRKSAPPSKRWRTFDVMVSVMRANDGVYRAEGCIKAGKMKDGSIRGQRCTERTGTSITGAVKNMLHTMASKLK